MNDDADQMLSNKDPLGPLFAPEVEVCCWKFQEIPLSRLATVAAPVEAKRKTLKSKRRDMINVRNEFVIEHYQGIHSGDEKKARVVDLPIQLLQKEKKKKHGNGGWLFGKEQDQQPRKYQFDHPNWNKNKYLRSTLRSIS